MYKKHVTFSFFTLVTCCLIGLLTACGQQPVTGTGLSIGVNNNQTIAMSTQKNGLLNIGMSTQQTVLMPATQTSCPADGTARAAVIKSLALGKNQNLVYIYNEVPLNTTIAYGHLKRYDMVTHQKTTIATSGLSIQSAQVSADGQWIMFLSTPDPRGDRLHSAILQLVRMDGQGLQTLYCFPAMGGNQPDLNHPLAQWSVDQKSILFSYNTASTSVITLLNVATGTLHPEINFHDSQQLYQYSVAFWLDNTHAYVEKTGTSGPLPPMELDLLNIKTNKNLNGGDLTKVLVHSVRMSNFSLDSSYDGSKLFTAYCLEAANPFDTTITVRPATGGTQHTIYHQAPTICSGDIRAITPSQLLITAKTYNTQVQSLDRNQSWTMKTDGSGKKILFDLPANGDSFSLNHSSQYPWSNLSRNSNFYAIQSINNNTGQTTILIGALVGGTPSGIANTTRGNVDIAGWTTM